MQIQIPRFLANFKMIQSGYTVSMRYFLRVKKKFDIYATRVVKEVTDALTFRDLCDCFHETMESYFSLNEAVTRTDKLFTVLPRCILQRTACAIRRFAHNIQAKYNEVSNQYS